MMYSLKCIKKKRIKKQEKNKEKVAIKLQKFKVIML